MRVLILLVAWAFGLSAALPHLMGNDDHSRRSNSNLAVRPGYKAPETGQIPQPVGGEGHHPGAGHRRREAGDGTGPPRPVDGGGNGPGHNTRRENLRILDEEVA